MKLLAVDGNSVLNRGYYAIPRLNASDGTPTNAVVGFLNILNRLVRLYKPDAVAIAFDVSRHTFRNDMFDGYKANRKGMPDDLREQLPIVKDLLTYMGYKLATAEGYEGDDVLGSLAAACQADGNACIVATGDRDCLQLIDDNVTVNLIKTKDDVLYNSEVFAEEYGFEPIHIIDLKALMGDSSDNIPGVRGVGEKTAAALIGEYKTIETIYETLDDLNAKPRVIDLLRNDRDMAFLSKKLATITSKAPVNTDIGEYVRGEGSPSELAALAARLDMVKLIEKTDGSVINTAEIAKEAADAAKLAKKAEKPIEKKIITVKSGTRRGGAISILTADGGLECCEAENGFTVSTFEEPSLFTALNDGKSEIYGYKTKEIYKRAEACGADNINIAFDAELAAYLINPDRKDYQLGDLFEEYLPEISVEGDERYADAARLRPLCEKLHKTLADKGLDALYNGIEQPLCRVLAQMETEGFQLDEAGLDKFGKRLENDIEITKEQIFRLAGREFSVNSTKESGAVLFDELKLPSGKKTKTGYSTSAEVLEEIADLHPIVPQILEYRKLTKLYSTYVLGLKKAIYSDGRVHSTFNQTETRTGRISSLDPNVQNIPVRTELGSEMRRFFVAKEGYTLVDADYSQIELRILAHIANDGAMKQAFSDGVDIHSVTASQVFGVPLETLPPELRSRAKAINFGIVYGISPFSLAKDIHTSMHEAKEYIDAYLKNYSGVAEYMEKIVEQARENGFVSTIYGRRRMLPDINAKNKNVRAAAERIALNTPVQGTAADIIKLAMIKVSNRLKAEKLDARLILQIHDELIVEAAEDIAEKVKQLVTEEMENAAELSVPLAVDAHIGTNWYIAKG